MTVQNYALNLGLNEVPDDSLDPEVWEELQKVFQALKNLADSMDSGVNPGLIGTPGATVTIQNYSKVWKTPTVNITAGQVLQMIADQIHLVGTTYQYPILYAEKDVAAGTPGEFILQGAVYYPPGGLTIGSSYYVNTAVNTGSITTVATGRYVGIALGPSALYFNPKAY